MQLDEAIAKHIEWKVALRSAIARREEVDAATLRRDDCCDLGIWLRGDGATSYGGTPGFSRVVETHAEFHCRAGEVADTINAKNFELAEKMLDARSEYGVASIAVAGAIMELMRRI